MDRTGSNRGAWRRGPAPGALTRSRMAVMTAAAWSPEVEPRRTPDRLSSSAGEPVKASLPQDDVRHGGCLCGAVRYEVQGAPRVVGLCHCADCRKATGGAALHYAEWPRAAFSLTGRLASHAGRSFCPECGGRVAHLREEGVEVNLGSLDSPPTDFPPTMELWVTRREPWIAPVAGAVQYERDPGSAETRQDLAAE